MFATPHAIPARRLPAIAGTVVVVVALPVFLVAGWRLLAWVIAAALWLAYQGIGAWLDRLPLKGDNLTAAGLVAFGRMTRAVALVAVLIVVAVSDAGLGLPAAVVYALAFTVEFGWSLMAYFAGGVQSK